MESEREWIKKSSLNLKIDVYNPKDPHGCRRLKLKFAIFPFKDRSDVLSLIFAIKLNWKLLLF